MWSRAGPGSWLKEGTPAERINLLNDHVNTALRLPDVVTKVSELGGDVVGGTPEQFGKFMAGEDKKWADLVEKARLQVRAE